MQTPNLAIVNIPGRPFGLNSGGAHTLYAVFVLDPKMHIAQIGLASYYRISFFHKIIRHWKLFLTEIEFS